MKRGFTERVTVAIVWLLEALMHETFCPPVQAAKRYDPSGRHTIPRGFTPVAIVATTEKLERFTRSTLDAVLLCPTYA